MEPRHDLRRAITLLLQLSPSILGAAFITAILFDIITRSLGSNDEKKTSRDLPRKQIILGAVLIILSNVSTTFPASFPSHITHHGIGCAISFGSHRHFHFKGTFGFDG